MVDIPSLNSYKRKMKSPQPELEKAIEKDKRPAFKEKGLWQDAIKETSEVQESYNRLLGTLDHLCKIRSLEAACPSLIRLQVELNHSYDIRGILQPDTTVRYSLRWWLNRLKPSWWINRSVRAMMRPILESQYKVNGLLVHYLNDQQNFLSSHLGWQKEYLQTHMAFLLQITPWIDVKVRELRKEQNHNLAVQIGNILHEALPQELRNYNVQIQKQLSEIASVDGMSLSDLLRVEQQQVLDLQRQVDDLWHGFQSRRHELVRLSERVAEEQETRMRGLQEHLGTIENSVRQAEQALTRQQELLKSMEQSLQPGIRPAAYMVESMRLEMEDLKRQLQGMKTPPSTHPVAVDQASADSPSARDFRYFVFEEIFRGPQEFVREKMKVYIPYFQASPGGPVLDIGCGRGEFLQLMKENGVEAYGAELNSQEVLHLFERGLHAVQEDAVQHIHTLEKESLGGVFSAQVVEHLSPEQVYDLIASLVPVLKPGAPLVIETLNPLSLESFHSIYLLDPTHKYPVHPKTLVFWMRYAGFRDVHLHKITPFPEQVQLPQPDGMADEALKNYLRQLTSHLNEILYGYAEYYVIGYRP